MTVSVTLQPFDANPTGTTVETAHVISELNGTPFGESHSNVVSGDLLVSINSGGLLSCVDVGIKSAPSVVGTMTDAVNLGNCQEVDFSGAYVAAVSTDGIFSLIDVSKPSTPVRVGGITDAVLLAGASGVVCVGPHAYVACTSGRVHKIDIADQTNPRIIDTLFNITNLNGAYNIRARGRYLYVAAVTSNKLNVIDTLPSSSPMTLLASKTASIGINFFDLSGFWGYGTTTGLVSSGIDVWNLHDPTNPVLTTTIHDDVLAYPLRLRVSGGFLVISTQQDKGTVALVSLADPANPTVLREVVQTIPFEAPNAGELSHGFVGDFDGRYLYVTNFSLAIIDLVGPAGHDIAREIDILTAGYVNLSGDLDIDGTARIRTGMSIGVGGARSDGPLVSNAWLRPHAYTTAQLTAAFAVICGIGAHAYNSTTSKPAWSDGIIWRYADGSAV